MFQGFKNNNLGVFANFWETKLRSIPGKAM